MIEVVCTIVLVGVIVGVFYILRREYKREKEAIKIRQLVEIEHRKMAEIENSPEYKLKTLRNEYNEMVNSFDDKIKTFSDNFNFKIGSVFSINIDDVEDVINQNNLTKISYKNKTFYIKYDGGEFEILSLTREFEILSLTKYHAILYCVRFVSGEWDNDMKFLFVELYKKQLQREIDMKLKHIISLDINSANNYYKNN